MSIQRSCLKNIFISRLVAELVNFDCFLSKWELCSCQGQNSKTSGDVSDFENKSIGLLCNILKFVFGLFGP